MDGSTARPITAASSRNEKRKVATKIKRQKANTKKTHNETQRQDPTREDTKSTDGPPHKHTRRDEAGQETKRHDRIETAREHEKIRANELIHEKTRDD